VSVVKQIRDRVAGLDVHRDSVIVCCRVRDSDGSTELAKRQFSTTRSGLGELTAFLHEYAVTTVAMEATGVYWKAPYYALEGLFEELWLCNAQHVKNVPGRKSDLSDAEWLADVAAHGMVRPSFVPPPAVRELRELTRYRKTQVDARTKEIQRLEKVLQDAGIKLTSVASRAWGASAREIIEALIAGERDPAVLARLAKGRMRSKIARLEEALAGSFGAHHAVVCRQIIDHIDFLDQAIDSLSAEIAARLVPFESAVTIISSITGISQTTAEVIIAETGAEMSRFPTAGHLCAWAGLAPASYESAGKHRPAGTRNGAPWLRRTLIEAARAAARTKGSYYSAQYARIARRRGPNKAAVAVAHSMLAVVWQLLTTGQLYTDPGADYFQRRHDPAAEAKRLTRRIEALGFQVTLHEQAA
jgi:transposase